MSICFIAIYVYMLLLTPMGFLRDGGTVRHILNGQYMLQNHRICTTNYLWYVDSNAPWLSTELLSDYVFALLYNLGGSNYQYIVMVSALSTSAALTLAAAAASRRGASLKALVPTLALAVVATSLHWSARPHLFSYLLFALTLYLGELQISTRWRAILYFLIFALWVNLHGSVVLGLLIVLCQVIVKLPGETTKNRLTLPLPLIAAFAGSLLNVRGPGYYYYLITYATNEHVFMQGSEWSSFDTVYGVGAYAFLALIALTAVWQILYRLGLKSRLPWLILTLILAGSAFISMRFISYFALMALFVVPAKDKAESGKTKCDKKSLLVIATGLAISIAFIATNKISDLNKGQMPVATTDYLKQFPPEQSAAKQQGGFCYDNWGNYIALKCDRKFFIDDKTDFYPTDFNVVYRACLAAEPGYEQFFKISKFGYVLIPKTCPLAQSLRQKSEWRVVKEDNISVLFYPQNNQ